MAPPPWCLSLTTRALPLADMGSELNPCPHHFLLPIPTFLWAFFSPPLQSRLNMSSKPSPGPFLAHAYFSAWDVLPSVSSPSVPQSPQLSVPFVEDFLSGCEKCHSQSPSLSGPLLTLSSHPDVYIYHIKMSASGGREFGFFL